MKVLKYIPEGLSGMPSDLSLTEYLSRRNEKVGSPSKMSLVNVNSMSKLMAGQKRVPDYHNSLSAS